jgi:hypothetical protein
MMMVRTLLVAAAALMCVPLTPVHANENFAVWAAAHERLIAKWRHEPRCGWTVGGYTCSKKRYANRHRFQCAACAW